MVEHRRVFPLKGGHRLDDCLRTRDGLFVKLRVFKSAHVHPRHHARQILQASHALELDKLIVKVSEGELVGLELLLELGGLFRVERGLRLFNERQNVSHAENTRRHASGVEGLDLIELFARADKLDGLSCDGFDRKRSAASRVAVEL